MINQNIDSEDFVLESPTNTSIKHFYVIGRQLKFKPKFISNRRVKYLPKSIGELFPNLEEFCASFCGLTIVRDFYFKNMRSLERLLLGFNQITTIEAKAFDDLVSLYDLDLHGNLIETLDEKLFIKMVNLAIINLNSNSIKFLNPATFKIPGNGRLSMILMWANYCIAEHYVSDNVGRDFTQMESDLKANCTQ